MNKTAMVNCFYKKQGKEMITKDRDLKIDNSLQQKAGAK